VYVDDVVDAILRSAESEQAVGQTFQLVDSEIINQREYVNFCRPALPDIKFTYAPMLFLYCAATGLEILSKLLKRSVPLTIYRLRSLKRSIEFDCSAAKDNLGWTPRVGLRAGLQKTFVAPTPSVVPFEAASEVSSVR
jgi:nucleoside-diphosphate-sugar epimerase